MVEAYKKEDLKLENLKIGMKFKNYRLLCEKIGIQQEFAGFKLQQIRELAKFFTFSKTGNGHEIIINEIFDEPKETTYIDKRKFKFNNHFDSYQVPMENKFDAGVFIIKKDNLVYIGSTITKFRLAFNFIKRDEDRQDKRIRDMLLNGGSFKVLYVMNREKDTRKDLINIEKAFIDIYKQKNGIMVIN